MAARWQKQIKILSFLLQFPDALVIQDLEPARRQIEAEFTGADREHIRSLVRHLLHTPVLALQEEFTATFDLQPRTSLNLTYHVYGEDKARGKALARFARAYEDAGLEMHRPEIPDYLPMVLELLYLDPDRDHRWLITEHRQVLLTLARRLEAMENPYSIIFTILAQMFAESDPQVHGSA